MTLAGRVPVRRLVTVTTIAFAVVGASTCCYLAAECVGLLHEERATALFQSPSGRYSVRLNGVEPDSPFMQRLGFGPNGPGIMNGTVVVLKHGYFIGCLWSDESNCIVYVTRGYRLEDDHYPKCLHFVPVGP